MNKINSELHAMPGEWERLREEWHRSNDNGTNSTAAGSLTGIATTLTLMKDRLNHMQLLLREVSSREETCGVGNVFRCSECICKGY